MKQRKVIIIVFIIAIVLIIGGCSLYILQSGSNKKGKEANKAMSSEEARQYVEKLTDLIINGGTKEELTTALCSDEILDTYIMTGEDMYLLQRPDDTTIKKYSLQQYVTISKELATRLEEKIQNNFEYIIDDITNNNGFTSVQITYKTYYYNAYINDLSAIQNQLLTLAGYDLEKNVDSEQLKVDIYKAKIKAASILDNYLDKYVNSNETNTTFVSFISKNTEESSNEFISYLINLNGFTYDNSGFITDEESLDNILSNYNTDNPLAL